MTRRTAFDTAFIAKPLATEATLSITIEGAVLLKSLGLGRDVHAAMTSAA